MDRKFLALMALSKNAGGASHHQQRGFAVLAGLLPQQPQQPERIERRSTKRDDAPKAPVVVEEVIIFHDGDSRLPSHRRRYVV